MKKVILATWAFAPVLAFAANELSNVTSLVTQIGAVVKVALPIVVALALLVFFWGLVKFIFNQGNEEAKADGKKLMLWGLIALFVMISVWGLVNYIGSALGITAVPTVTVPTVNNI